MAEIFERILGIGQQTPLPLLLSFVVAAVVGIALIIYLAIFIAAPIPRESFESEKKFHTVDVDGKIISGRSLPCWQDAIRVRRKEAHYITDLSNSEFEIEDPDVIISIVVPAFNEENRLGVMLRETVDYLQQEYRNANPTINSNGALNRRKSGGIKTRTERSHRVKLKDEATFSEPIGWEILVVSDGSTDMTTATALDFARDLRSELSSSIRVVTLRKNRGKGGAVTHGMRHARGQYVLFADADGASKIEDLGKLIQACKKVQDAQGRAVAVGSRAHLEGSGAVVKPATSWKPNRLAKFTQRSLFRSFLMFSFHLLIRLLTPPATAAIRDTQCGFKLFSRPSLPYIIPHMHTDSWIFDVEMLMLAESAQIPVVEVPIGWHEVGGSKLNIIWASLDMAWGLAVLRAAWAVGVYRRW